MLEKDFNAEFKNMLEDKCPIGESMDNKRIICLRDINQGIELNEVKCKECWRLYFEKIEPIKEQEPEKDLFDNNIKCVNCSGTGFHPGYINNKKMCKPCNGLGYVKKEFKSNGITNRENKFLEKLSIPEGPWTKDPEYVRDNKELCILQVLRNPEKKDTHERISFFVGAAPEMFLSFFKTTYRIWKQFITNSPKIIKDNIKTIEKATGKHWDQIVKIWERTK